MSRRRFSLALTSIFALAILAPAALAAPPAPAAPPHVRLTDIEAEVMCPICGTLLELSESPQGKRERAFIARLIAAGETKSQIKDALVAQYGPAVLALPRGSGFDLSAYLAPAIALLVATAALALGLRRWRLNARPPGGRPVAAPRGEAAERLDADIARYDL